MKKNRYLLCLLLCTLLLYFAVPQLSLTAPGAEGVFSVSWLSLALMVIAGNLTAILYSPKRQVQRKKSAQVKQKARSFH